MYKGMSIKVGPGGDHSNGRCWDDGSIGKVRQIFISYSDYSINSIQTVLEFSEGSVLMDRHGGEGSKFSMISLAPDESIILVSGSYNTLTGSALKSLKIVTTLHEYGPFTSCEAIGLNHQLFSYEVEADKFAGFHGRSDDYSLYAIGIHVRTEATITLKELMKQGNTIDKMMGSPSVPLLTGKNFPAT